MLLTDSSIAIVIMWNVCPCLLLVLVSAGINIPLFGIFAISFIILYSIHSEKSQANQCYFTADVHFQQQNWAQFVMYINSDCKYIGDLWLQLWLTNHCKNTGYYSIFPLLLLMLLNNYQYNCNNTISSVSVVNFMSFLLSSMLFQPRSCIILLILLYCE